MRWPFDEITTQHLGLALALLITALASALDRRLPRRRK